MQDDVVVLVGGVFPRKPEVRLLDERTLLVDDDVLEIPEPVERDVNAKFKNGVLSVVMRRKKSELEIPRWGETSET